MDTKTIKLRTAVLNSSVMLLILLAFTLFISLITRAAVQTTTHGGVASGIVDVPVPADYDGDGKDDIAYFRPSTGAWEIIKSSDSLTLSYTLGGISSGIADIPVPADYDGDGTDDIGYYRTVTGEWNIIKSSDGQPLTQTHGSIVAGIADVPVPADYDNDGSADVAYFRPSTGEWEIIKSSDSLTLSYTHGGLSSGIADIPVPGDYDGDTIVDVAYYRTDSGAWEIIKSSDALTLSYTHGSITAGIADIPAPGDYDGDGTDDIAYFRPSTGAWEIVRSSDSQPQTEIVGGINSGVADIPVNAEYVGSATQPAIFRPLTGEWMILEINEAPTIQITEPDGTGDTADTNFVITWTDSDADDNASISLYYDTNNTGQDGTLIVSGISEDDATNSYTWNTTSVTPGSYYIYGIINDGVNAPVVDYSYYAVQVTGNVLCPTSTCNGDFESAVDLEYWKTGNGTNQIVTDVVQDGAKAYYSEHIYDSGVNPRWSGISQSVTVESAQTYGLTGFYRSDDAAQGHVKITWKDSGGTVLQVDYPITNINGTNTSWIEFSKLIIAPAGAATAEIKIWHGVNTSSQNQLGSKLWFDSLLFEVATTACGTLCNESFEHGVLYWIQSGAVGSHTIEQTGVHEGLKMLKSEQLYTSGDETKWAGVTQYALVKEGTTYRLRLWLKTLNAANGHVRIRWRTEAGALLSTQYPITGIGGANSSWFAREVTVTAPATASRAEIAIWHGVTTTNATGSTLWIDDITMICQSLCNGGFEDGNVHWETNGINEGEIVTTDVQEGAQAIKILQSLGIGDQTQWAGVSQRTLVTGGGSYSLSFWLKKENAVQGHVKIKWRDANDTLLSQQFPIGGISGTNLTWAQMSTALTAPPTAETIEIFIWHGVNGANQNAVGSTLYVDNVTLTQNP